MLTALPPSHHIKATSLPQTLLPTNPRGLQRLMHQAIMAKSMKTRCQRCPAGVAQHHKELRTIQQTKTWKWVLSDPRLGLKSCMQMAATIIRFLISQLHLTVLAQRSIETLV